MKLTKEHTKLFAIALITFLLTLQFNGMFRGKKVDEESIRNKVKLENLEEKRIADSLYHVKEIALKDSLISVLKNKEAVIVNQYIKSDEKLKNIPGIVSSRSVQQLLQSAIDY